MNSPGFIALLRRFLIERRAIAAVEFALLTPVALALMAGVVDLTQALAVKRKMIEIAHTVSDLVAQRTEISQADVTSVLTGSSAILLPYDTTDLDIVVSVVNVVSGQNVVAWASARGTTAPAANSKLTSVTIPSNIVISGVEVVVAQVSYAYKPPFSGLFGESFAMNETKLARPRSSKVITLK